MVSRLADEKLFYGVLLEMNDTAHEDRERRRREYEVF